MTFFQEPPRLGNQYEDDPVLRAVLRRALPAEVLAQVETSCSEMGELAAGRLHDLGVRHRLDEPVHVPYDPWGRRVDRIEVNAAWREYARVAAEKGLVALAYERQHAEWSRLHQVALVYLFAPSSQVYTCPLAMTDGCARTLEIFASGSLRERVLPRLLSRDPARAWTSGQWMTERTGGSDVGLTETLARLDDEGTYRLHGTKWFTSAVTSEVALTLARPEGNGPGGKGLALFFVELRDEEGALNGITVNRLKDKLGTRHLPTAELTLDGTRALPIAGLVDGIRQMASMLNLTRTWNAVCAVAGMRRGLALARAYARRRVAFGAPLSEKALHLDTLAGLAAEHEAATVLTFHEVELLGRAECGVATADEKALVSVLHPIIKLLTAKMAVASASEVLEAFGGAGYVEDTGLPALLRDSQVLPIWEGTTNVLALETLRAFTREDAFRPFIEALRAHAGHAEHSALVPLARLAVEVAEGALAWAASAASRSRPELEAGARRLCFALGRSFALALLVEHAEHALRSGDRRSLLAAERFAAHGLSPLSPAPYDLAAARTLALGDAGD